MTKQDLLLAFVDNVHIDNGAGFIGNLQSFNSTPTPPDACPLCAIGSEAIRPRATPENWARLTAA